MISVCVIQNRIEPDIHIVFKRIRRESQNRYQYCRDKNIDCESSKQNTYNYQKP